MKWGVLVAGDPTLDQFLLFHPPQTNKQDQDWERHNRYILRERPGGVHQTISSLEKIKGLKIHPYVAHRPNNRQLCSLVELICVDEVNSKSPKINRLPKFGSDLIDARVEFFRGYFERREETSREVLSGNANSKIKNVKLVVLNDAGGHLRSDNIFYKILNKTIDADTVVIHKRHLPLNDRNELENVITKNSNRVLLHLSSDDLKKNGVRIRSDLSWKYVIDDLQTALTSRNSILLKFVKSYSNVLIQFDVEAAALLTNVGGDSLKVNCEFVFDSSRSEGDHRREFPGFTFGIMNAFLWGLVSSLKREKQCKLPRSRDLKYALASARLYSAQYFKIGRVPGKKHDFSVIPPSLDIDSRACESEAGTLAEQCIPALNQSPSPDLGIPEDEEKLFSLAKKIVCNGDGEISDIPHVKYGNLLTVDPEEIVSYRSIKRIIENYIDDKSREKPISIAVFGKPGSGKSFGLKEIIEPLSIPFREYNLTEIDADDLPGIFHELRDVGLGGQVPLCFFDEFDRDKCSIVSRFLAPMQDGEFRDKGRTHPIGRAILVFAGGTAKSLADFRQGKALKIKKQNSDESNDSPQILKIPDFVSRLNGVLEIKGLGKASDQDHAMVLRRALLMRSMLERFTGDTVLGAGGEADISSNLLKAFLHIADYRSDARSMEKIVTMSSLRNTAQGYRISNLPPEHLLKMHLKNTKQFMRCVSGKSEK